MSGIKSVRLEQTPQGIILAAYADMKIAPGSFADGDVTNHASIAPAIADVARAIGVSAAHVSLSESKSYLFETAVAGRTKEERRIVVEQHLDELVPLSAG